MTPDQARELFIDWVNAALGALCEEGGDEYDFLVNAAQPRAETLGIEWAVVAALPQVRWVLDRGEPNVRGLLVGGPNDGLPVLLPEGNTTFDIDGARYVRRSAGQHPVNFITKTGGPNAGHWIFDHQATAPPRST